MPRPRTRKRPGRDFEEAVHRFVQALGPDAEVLFDHRLPDKETGTLRQVDVWINTKLFSHFPVSILVSCKDYKRRLNIGDIEKFHAEVQSTSASTGVIYARSGFFGPALTKAKKMGVACCRLYRDEAADLPSTLLFESYACRSRIQLRLGLADADASMKTWDDLFHKLVQMNNCERTVLDLIEAEFLKGEKASAMSHAGGTAFPQPWQSTMSFSSGMSITISGTWRGFRGRLEAHLLKGSYCATDGSFVGSMTTPPIDVRGPTLGPGWIEIDGNPDVAGKGVIIAKLLSPDVRRALREQLGCQPINPET